MGTLRVVVGGQYGSESKGAVTAWLAQTMYEQHQTQAVIRVAGPNAGHTAYDERGRRWALRQIPVAAVVAPTAQLFIAAGSEIDPPVLAQEIADLEAAGIPVIERLYIDGQATVINDGHKAVESATGLVAKVGSTGKGIGAARSDRLMRRAQTWGQWWDDNPDERNQFGYGPHHTQALLQELARAGVNLTIEGTQGYALGLHAGHYPQCTSSDCRAVDFLAMAGIAPWDQGVTDFQIWLVARAFPIRVAGNSGPLKGETTWGELGLPEEYTTVTKKVRRVGMWDEDLLCEAVQANGGGPWVRIAFAMADQMFPGLTGLNGKTMGEAFDALGGDLDREAQAREDLDRLGEFINRVTLVTGAQVGYVGTGPFTRIWFGDRVLAR